MQAKKCDRCGKYYDENKETYTCEDGFKIPVGGLVKTIGKRSKRGSEGENIGGSHIDLCDDCLEQFDFWVINANINVFELFEKE